MKRKAVIMAMIMCMMGTSVGGAGTVLVQAEAADTTNAVEEGRYFFRQQMLHSQKGKAFGPDNEKEPTSYDEETGMIRAAAQGTEIEYTVPEGTEGTF